MAKRKVKFIIGQVLLNLFFITLCLICLIPILYALSVSLNAENTFLSSDFRFLPRQLTLDNYVVMLTEKPFFLWLKNTIVLSFSTVIISLTIGIPAAYAFSRYKFTGRNSLLKGLVMLNAFPSILSMFALYNLLRPLGLINSYSGLLMIYTGTMMIFSVWNMKGYFDTIPEEIEEAGKIDGATDLQIIMKIIIPLARPTIIVTAVMVLISVWNEYIFAINFMTGAENYTLAAGLYALQATEYSTNWPLFSAASLLTSVPILILFFMIQKQMKSGLTSGGVKG